LSKVQQAESHAPGHPHNPKVIGSNPVPATNHKEGFSNSAKTLFFILSPSCHFGDFVNTACLQKSVDRHSV
jgi:hypothetical protein